MVPPAANFVLASHLPIETLFNQQLFNIHSLLRNELNNYSDVGCIHFNKININ